MKSIKTALRRPLYGLSALALTAGLALTAILPSLAYANSVTERSIQMSDSTPDASGASYSFSFKPAQTANIGAIVVDFCSDTPLIGTNCAYPAGFDLGSTPSINATAGVGGFSTSTGSWVTTSSAQGGAAAGSTQTLFLTNSTPQTPTGTTTAITFTIDSVHNPTALGTFYARILTFDTASNATTSYTTVGTTRASSFTGNIDSGGAALSTVQQIQITARVMETLTFCTSGTNIDGSNPAFQNCSAATVPQLTIGHGTGTLVIDNTQVDAGKLYTQLSTNASNGADIYMKAVNACTEAGLSKDGGATCSAIPGLNNTAAGAMTAGTPNFGLFVSDSSTTTGVTASTGTVAPDANYHDAAHVDESTMVNPNLYFGMDNANVISTFGDLIASCTGPVDQINNHLVFGATAGITTPAGIYSANEILIATGSF